MPDAYEFADLAEVLQSLTGGDDADSPGLPFGFSMVTDADANAD